MQDTAAILEEILLEADALIRQRQQDRGLEFPHLVVAVAPDGQVVLRSNVSPDGLRSFSEDLENVAAERGTWTPVDPALVSSGPRRKWTKPTTAN
jgi:hypothetical protein